MIYVCRQVRNNKHTSRKDMALEPRHGDVGSMANPSSLLRGVNINHRYLSHRREPSTALLNNRNAPCRLINGAWADGSSWGEVIPRLQAVGKNVTVVQNPPASLADSVAATDRTVATRGWPRPPGIAILRFN
jgi:hypothetical protein